MCQASLEKLGIPEEFPSGYVTYVMKNAVIPTINVEWAFCQMSEKKSSCWMKGYQDKISLGYLQWCLKYLADTAIFRT